MDINFDDILAKKWVVPAAIGVVGVISGATAGYLVGKKQGVKKFLEAVDRTLHESPYQQLNFDDLPGKADVDVDEVTIETEPHVDGVLTTYGGHTLGDILKEAPIVEVSEEELVQVNVFENPEQPWDQEAEEASRADGREFYILNVAEFIDSETGYHQETLTYYKADDILSDEDNNPIYGYSGMMGDLRFGYGSNDPNIVYIRNDAIHKEWEILLHTGMFAVEVLGLEVEAEYEAQDLRHSNTRRFKDE